MTIDPETGEVIGTNLIVYDPTIPHTFSQALVRAGMTNEDLVLLKTGERQEAIRFISAQGLGYDNAEDLLRRAPVDIQDQWRFMCGYISMIDADVAEEVAIRFLYDAWKVSPTPDRLQTVLDHVLNENNQHRYYRMIPQEDGTMLIKKQPPFYMLNGFFGAVYAGKMSLDKVISVFKHDVDWHAGTVSKIAELYGGAISTTMRHRHRDIKRLGKKYDKAKAKENLERLAELEQEMILIDQLADEKIEQLNTLYENSSHLSRAVLIRQRNRILGRESKNGPPHLTSDVIKVVERIVSTPPGLPSEVRLDGKKINVGGYKQVTLLMPLAEDGTDLPIYGTGYLEQLKALINQYKLIKGGNYGSDKRKR